MQHQAHEACAAFVGIDWADSTHDVCLHAAGSATRACLRLTHTPAALDAWITTLRTRCNGQPMALCLARTTGPLVSAVRTYDFLTRFPINPLTLARSCDACTPSRATDDPPDAARQRALLLPHRDTLQPRKPPSPAMRALAHLVAHRRRVVDDSVRITPRLTRTLKNSVPHVLQWFQDQDTTGLCDVCVVGRPAKRRNAPGARRLRPSFATTTGVLLTASTHVSRPYTRRGL